MVRLVAMRIHADDAGDIRNHGRVRNFFRGVKHLIEPGGKLVIATQFGNQTGHVMEHKEIILPGIGLGVFLKLKEEHGAEVTMVDQDAPAAKAGLQEHDVILSLNGSAVESAAQLRRMIKETPPGRAVALCISRDGQPLTIKVQLADRHKSMDWDPANHEFHFDMPKISIPDFDVPMEVIMGHASLRNGLMIGNIRSEEHT